MHSSTFYILCGLPFSGKTTLTKKLIERLGYVSVNIDDIKSAHGLSHLADDEMKDEEWEKIYDESYATSLMHLLSGKSVLYDSSNLTRKVRDDIRSHMKKRGNFPIKIVWVDTSLSLVEKRHLENKLTQERFEIPERIFREAIEIYQPPTNDENVIHYTEDIDIDSWISKNFLK